MGEQSEPGTERGKEFFLCVCVSVSACLGGNNSHSQYLCLHVQHACICTVVPEVCPYAQCMSNDACMTMNGQNILYLGAVCICIAVYACGCVCAACKEL